MNARVRRIFTVSIVSIGGFTAIVVVNLVTILAAPTTHALSLTNLTESLTQTLRALTGSSHSSTSHTSNSSTTTGGSTTPANSTTTPVATSSTPTTTTPDATPISEPPIEVDIQPINAMKPLVQPTTATHPEISFNPTIAQIAFRVTGLGSGVTSDPAPIQPTGQGWRILGVLWYFWVLSVAIIVVLGLIFKRVLGKFFLGLINRKGLLTKF